MNVPLTSEILNFILILQFFIQKRNNLDSPGYCQNAFSKQQLYAAHGILPSVHLLTTYENQAYPLNTEFVEKMIYYYFLR